MILRSFASPMHPGSRTVALRGPRPRTLGALVLATLVAVAGCASENARFYTELTQPGSLAAGAPVVNLGSSIGLVASVSPLADGNAGVAFDVNRTDADAIRRDSIMVLQNDPGGASLDVMTTNPLSPPASPGTQIDGASNQNDANALVAAKNLAASAPAMAMMMTAPGNSAAAMNASPAWLLLQQQIAMLQSQFLIAGVQGAGVAAQQLQQVNQNAAALERQLVAAGHSAQAEQLRRQVDALAHTLTTPPPGMIPPPGTSPPTGTYPPSATFAPYGTPPAYGRTAPRGSAPGATLVIPPVR
jgi:hypothetical protein